MFLHKKVPYRTLSSNYQMRALVAACRQAHNPRQHQRPQPIAIPLQTIHLCRRRMRDIAYSIRSTCRTSITLTERQCREGAAASRHVKLQFLGRLEFMLIHMLHFIIRPTSDQTPVTKIWHNNMIARADPPLPCNFLYVCDPPERLPVCETTQSLMRSCHLCPPICLPAAKR